MKKLLTVLIALSLVFSGFAAEPVASADMVDFTGEASVTWGYDLDTEKTGFINETDVELILSLLPADVTKSTEGSGIWGELVLLVDGDTNFTSDTDGTPMYADFADVTVDAAKLHFNDIYVGITSGDFDYGDDFFFPNALNYANEDSDLTYWEAIMKALEAGENPDLTGANMVSNYSLATGFNQGIVAGYENDMFSIEGSIRSRASEVQNAEIDAVDIYTANGNEVDNPLIKYFRLYDEAEVASDNLVSGTDYYRVTYDSEGVDGFYHTNDYAIGGYAEVKPIQDLRIALGGSYILSGQENDIGIWGEGDSQFFVGADYAFMIDDVMSIVPAITYNMMNVEGEDKAVRQSVTAGLAYRWGESEDAQSLLDDFYGEKLLVYMNDNNDEDDTMLLPGVAVWTDLNFNEVALDTPMTKKYLPIMATVYSGDLNGLKAYGLFYANVAEEAGLQPNITAGSAENFEAALPSGMQIGAAASYDIPVGDMTITPAAGVLARHVAVYDSADDKASYTSIMPSVRVDLAGAVSNTTFTAEWSGSEFKSASDSFDSEYKINPKKGLISLKAKIAL